MEQRKVCIGCKIEKDSVQEFYVRQRRRGDKIHRSPTSYCKICHTKQSTARNNQNPEKYKKAQKEWREKNRLKIKSATLKMLADMPRSEQS